MPNDATIDGLTSRLVAISPAHQASLEQARNAVAVAAQPDAWKTAIAQYRAVADQVVTSFVRDHFGMIPGVSEIAAALAQELEEVSRPLSLGPATLKLNVQSAYSSFPGVADGGVRAGFFPPTGLGFQIDAAAAKGGGMLDFQMQPYERLSGSFEIAVGVVRASALAVLQRTPNGFSLITLLSGRFNPGIQLGFGFAVTGVGGLVGINREVNVDALRVQFTNGAIVNALFGEDPIRNASTVLATLGSVFAPRADSHIIGPTLQISWLKVAQVAFFRFDLGVFVQLPMLRVDIIGSARAEVPPTFGMRLDVRGEIDPAREMITFAAALVDSHVLQVFRMTGTAAFQAHYGDRGFTVLTIGGFYPGFNPEPAFLPPQRRVALTVDIPLPINLRAEAYFAVTTSTVQFGGLIEASIGTDDFNANGHFSLDAIVQLSPFWFKADVSGGFALVAFGKTFYGVDVKGTITGPGPVVIYARISYRPLPLFPPIKWSDTFRIGSDVPPSPKIPSLAQALAPELSASNIRAEGGDDRRVTVSRRAASAGLTLVSPLGKLLWSQKRAPLELLLQRFEGEPLAFDQKASLSITGQKKPVSDRFAPAMFRNLTESELLNQPAFDWLPAGWEIAFEVVRSGKIEHLTKFDEYYKPERPQTIGDLRTFGSALVDGVTGRTAAPAVANLTPRVGIKDEQWAVREGPAQTLSASQTAAHIEAKRTGGVALPGMDVVNLAVTI